MITRPKYISMDHGLHKKDRPTLCNFCSNGGKCIFEDGLKKDEWCAVFEPRKDRYYNVIYQSRFKYDYGNMLGIMTKLFQLIPNVIHICMNHEKPNVLQWGQCPYCQCNLAFYLTKGSEYFLCGACEKRFLKKDGLRVYEKMRFPLSEHFLELKKRIPHYIRFLLKRGERERSDKRRVHKGEQECQK